MATWYTSTAFEPVVPSPYTIESPGRATRGHAHSLPEARKVAAAWIGPARVEIYHLYELVEVIPPTVGGAPVERG